jgi:hypothetical protein
MKKLSVFILCAVAFIFSSCSTTKDSKSYLSATTLPSMCPLTGLPAPGGSVPNRPALAIKVDNYPTARPQSGLMHADVIYEEPVEGGITRYVAVFQCQGSQEVGPVRSARAIDAQILPQLSDPLFIHAGGIDPVLSLLHQAAIHDIEIFDYPSLQIHPSGRYAPYDTYISTSSGWSIDSSDNSVPNPIFAFSDAMPPNSQSVQSFNVDFSWASNVTWQWSSQDNKWLRYYNTNRGVTQAVTANGNPIAFTNVIVQMIKTYLGPWAENSSGSKEVMTNLISSGPAYIFTDGEMIKGTWSRSSVTEATQYLNANGNPIALHPGNTWVELLPQTGTFSYQASSGTS